jgi:hypothetical protein
MCLICRIVIQINLQILFAFGKETQVYKKRLGLIELKETIEKRFDLFLVLTLFMNIINSNTKHFDN